MNFDRLDTYLKQYIASAADIPGVDVIIQQDHKTLFRAQYGYSDLGNKTPISGDEQYYLYSCSKPLTVTGAMRLVEEGKLDLDTPVSKYLPFFGDVYLENDGLKRAPQTPITVRHLFTMTAGFTYNMDTTAIQELLKNGNRRIETVQYAKAITASPLAFEPGTKYNYSLCHDLLGAVIEAVSDMPFGEYQKKTIFEPLGMERTGFLTTLSEPLQMASIYSYHSKERITVECPDPHLFGLHSCIESGGAGVISTVHDYACFADTMANDGLSADGYRLLKPETIRMMKEEQLSKMHILTPFSCAAGPGYGYALGVRTLVNHDLGQRSPLGEFGWDGAAGSYVMIDTENHLSIFFATHLLGWHNRFGSIHAPVRDLTYECLGI